MKSFDVFVNKTKSFDVFVDRTNSFNVFVDGGLTQSNLIVVNLAVYNDIATYSYMVINGTLAKQIVAEMLITPLENMCDIVVNSMADVASHKYEVFNTTPILIDATVKDQIIFFIKQVNSRIELQQTLREIANKYSSFESQYSIYASASEVKTAIIKCADDESMVIVDAQLSSPYVRYYNAIGNDVSVCVSLDEILYVIHIDMIQSNIKIDAEIAKDVELWRMYTLKDVDALGTISDIGDTSLQDLSYNIIW